MSVVVGIMCVAICASLLLFQLIDWLPKTKYYSKDHSSVDSLLTLLPSLSQFEIVDCRFTATLEDGGVIPSPNNIKSSVFGVFRIQKSTSSAAIAKFDLLPFSRDRTPSALLSALPVDCDLYEMTGGNGFETNNPISPFVLLIVAPKCDGERIYFVLQDQDHPIRR